ncbi:MAG TPA: hypothetical protein PKJ63_00755 [Cyclobacteriaceae bacterium]|nr:hypothetical protein [Cyclobacteriaceae bacterium]
MPLRSSYAVFILILLLSCQEDAVVPVKEPNPLMEYLVDFLKEAEKRGVEIDTTRLVLELVDNVEYDGVQYCGVGISRSGSRTPTVRISKIGRCWSQQDYYFKKELLFHEFGHALLARLHDNDTLPNGAKRSIMAQGIYRFFQNETKLVYYLDELFDPSTPVPDWAK